jgi:hypothetical protein
MENRIRNERELQEWEARIGSVFARHYLDYVLGGVRQSPPRLRDARPAIRHDSTKC